jgi:hypothetical protein
MQLNRRFYRRGKRGHSELAPIPQTPPKGDRVLGFKLLEGRMGVRHDY